MSNTLENDVSTSLCANCGKGEEAGINLKACTACRLVKYCNRECQIAHRPQHKKACKKRAAELHDIELFKQPPPMEDCPICMVRLPTLESGTTYMVCCGKLMCCGCIHAFKSRSARRKDNICPFCRTLPPNSVEEKIKMYEKRSDMNDVEAIFHLGAYYDRGMHGFPQNRNKALELWHRAGELGHAASYHEIGAAYKFGNGVEVDLKKNIHSGN